MRQGWIALAVFCLVVLSLSLVPITSALADDPSSEVVARINRIRVQNGLTPLVIDAQLVASAQAYARAMARGGFFGHIDPGGSTMVTRNEAAGYSDWTVLEENIASGQSSVAEVVDAWLHSQGHRDNLLSPTARETGVGFVYLPGSPFGYYWVEEFGARIGPPPPSSNAPIALPSTAATPLPAKSPSKPTSVVVVARPAAPLPVTASPTSPAVPTAVSTPIPVNSPPESANLVVDLPEPTLVPASAPSTPRPEAVVRSTILESQSQALQAGQGPIPLFHREQRDPDNLNLFLIQYQNLD